MKKSFNVLDRYDHEDGFSDGWSDNEEQLDLPILDEVENDVEENDDIEVSDVEDHDGEENEEELEQNSDSSEEDVAEKDKPKELSELAFGDLVKLRKDGSDTGKRLSMQDKIKITKELKKQAKKRDPSAQVSLHHPSLTSQPERDEFKGSGITQERRCCYFKD
eukprot:TRINITY_DN7371_c0_g1_i1.p1 TRINITY_DN7371_c0_g1~~TRINITY_DN7371_c0_g1_i1.p1  ORF type:complete len:163 (-),score=41.05 TRINITY_DN7371_c0_g1_i1:427-915(-)